MPTPQDVRRATTPIFSVALILIGIVLVLLEANTSNQLVNSLLDAARWLTTPFHNVFKLHGYKANIGVNWGLAAVVYAFAGGVIARLLRR